MSLSIQLKSYDNLPRVGAAELIALLRSLARAAPEQRSELLQRCLDKLQAAHAALGAAWEGEVATTDQRAADIRSNDSWRALYKRLEGASELPADKYPQATEAAALLEQIFEGQGLAFLRLSFKKQWAQAQRRISRIKQGKLEPAIIKLAGQSFHDEIFAAQDHYGRVLGFTEVPADVADDPKLAELMTAAYDAALEYLSKLVGQVDFDDEESVRATQAALHPVDELRRRVAERRGARAAVVKTVPPAAPG